MNKNEPRLRHHEDEDALVELVCKRLDQGLNIKQIALRLDMGETVVRRIKKKHRPKLKILNYRLP